MAKLHSGPLDEIADLEESIPELFPCRLATCARSGASDTLTIAALRQSPVVSNRKTAAISSCYGILTAYRWQSLLSKRLINRLKLTTEN